MKWLILIAVVVYIYAESTKGRTVDDVRRMQGRAALEVFLAGDPNQLPIKRVIA